MSSWPPHDAGREMIGATRIFVLRLSLERGENAMPVPRVRIEAVGTGEVKHFTSIESAVGHLRGWLLRIAEGRGQKDEP